MKKPHSALLITARMRPFIYELMRVTRNCILLFPYGFCSRNKAFKIRATSWRPLRRILAFRAHWTPVSTIRPCVVSRSFRLARF